MNKLLEKYGDEEKEEQDFRMKLIGQKKNFKVEEEKKKSAWMIAKTKEDFEKEGGELLEIKDTKKEDEAKESKKEIQKPKQEIDKPKDLEKQKKDDNKAVEGEEEELEIHDYQNLTGI